MAPKMGSIASRPGSPAGEALFADRTEAGDSRILAAPVERQEAARDPRGTVVVSHARRRLHVGLGRGLATATTFLAAHRTEQEQNA